MTERAGWKVTKVHAHYSFEQEPFKKEYILGNQRARQEAVARGDDVQANFWKLLNNSNLGFDCRDNSQNKSLHLIYDEDAEIKFLTKYEGYKSTIPFLSLEARIRNIEEKYKDVENLSFNEQPFVETLKKEEIKKVTEEFNKPEGSKGKGNKVLSCVNRLEEAYADKSYTFVQDLEKEGVNSLFAVACKRQNNVRVSTRYIAAKLLINTKVSLVSFLYDCVDTFCFPNEKTQTISARHKIIKVLPYMLMTDTDSGSLEFIIIAEDSCVCGERGMRNILLKIFLDNDIHKRLDLSNEFFEQSDKPSLAVRKQVGLYEFENIEYGIVCAICVNPKEYLELYGILFNINKKHKGVKRGTKGMNFEKHARRILTIAYAREGTNRFSKKQKQTRFENKKRNMIMVTVEKAEFGQLNGKRYVLPDGISSLPYGHKDLEYIKKFKCETLENLTAQKIIQHHENNLLWFEQGVLARDERMRIIKSVLLQQPLFCKSGTLKRSQFQIESNTRIFCCVVYGGVSAISSTSMADPQTKTYDRKISGNILVLGSTAGGKTTFV